MEQRLAVLTAVLVTVEKVAAQGVCTGGGPQMSWGHGSPCNDPWACNQGGTCQHWQTADGCVADPNTCVGWRQTESECSPNWVPQENFDTGCCTIIQTGYDQPLYSHGNSGYCECKMVDGTSIETPELTCDEIQASNYNCQAVCDALKCDGCPAGDCVGTWGDCPASCDATEREWIVTQAPGPYGTACPAAGTAPSCNDLDGACEKGITVQARLIVAIALADIDEASFSDRFRADVVTVLQDMGVAYVGAIQVAVSQIEADVNDERWVSVTFIIRPDTTTDVSVAGVVLQQAFMYAVTLPTVGTSTVGAIRDVQDNRPEPPAPAPAGTDGDNGDGGGMGVGWIILIIIGVGCCCFCWFVIAAGRGWLDCWYDEEEQKRLAAEREARKREKTGEPTKKPIPIPLQAQAPEPAPPAATGVVFAPAVQVASATQMSA